MMYFQRYFYILAWLAYAALHFVAMRQLVPAGNWALFADSVFHAAMFATLSFALSNVIRYGKYDTLTLVQQIVNYIALGLIVVSLWLAVGCLFNYLIMSPAEFETILFTLPVRGLVGLLLYAVIILAVQKEPKEEISKNSEIAVTGTEKLERITVKMGQKIEIIPVDDIFYLQSDGDYVQIISRQGKFLKEQTMKYFEQRLPAERFTRVHRSYIVNIENISRIELYSKQNQLLSMKNGEQIKVSLAGYKALRMALNL